MREEVRTHASEHDSFGLLPWIMLLLTALAVVTACLIAVR